jgi:hypothetical protein
VLYVVNNWRRHGEDRGYSGAVDWYSSGVHLWPTGPHPAGYVPLATSPPRTWLLRHVGTLDPRARPGHF